MVVAQTQSRVAHAWSWSHGGQADRREGGLRRGGPGLVRRRQRPPPVNAWAPTVQELGEKLPAVLDLLEEEGDSDLDDVRK
jgi:hypothetical protein